jgi:hypothetical protein
MVQRSRVPACRKPTLSRAVRSLCRLLFSGCLVFALLWMVHPLFAGQRRARGLSGDQIVQLRKQSMSRRQLKTLNLVIVQYTADHDGLLPALDSPARLRTQLQEYRLTPAALICPFSNQAYRTNKNLAGKKLSAIANPTSTLLFWSPKAMPDGYYLALNADGRDRRITSSELSRMKRISRVP